MTYSSSFYSFNIFGFGQNKTPPNVQQSIKYSVETQTTSKFSLPVATLGRSIPYMVGTGRILEPNIIWRGNASTDQESEQQADPNTGELTKIIYSDIYILDLQMALCLGPDVKLKGIYQSDVAMWLGSAGPARTDITAELESTLLGGGVVFYGGSFTQTPDPLLIAAQPLGASGHPGLAYVIIKRAKLQDDYGNITFELERIPNPLALSGAINTKDGDVNVATALVDAITNDWGGGSVPIDQLDLVSFQQAATILAAENNFCSIMQTDSIKVSDIIQQLEAQARGSVYINPTTGLLSFALVRYEGVSLAPVRVFDEGNVLNLQDLSGSSWATVANQKKVTFTNRADNYKQGFAVAQNISVNATGGRAVNNSPADYPFVMNGDLANALAARDLALECVPAFVGTIEANRSSAEVKPGSVVQINWDDFEFEGVLCFVTKMRQMDINSERMVYEVEQLVYPDSSALIQSPDEDYSENIRFNPERPTSAVIITAPYQIAKEYAGTYNWSTSGGIKPDTFDGLYDIALPLLFVAADNPDQQSFDAFIDRGTGGFQQIVQAGRYATTATLDAAMTRFDGFTGGAITIQLNDVDREDNLLNQGGPYLMAIGNELLSYENPVKLSDGVWEVDVKRGWMDTVAEGHGTGAIVSLVSGGWKSYLGNVKCMAGDSNPVFRLTGRTKQGVTATATGLMVSSWSPSSRFIKPIRPTGTEIDGSRPTSKNLARTLSYTVSYTKKARMNGGSDFVGSGGGPDAFETAGFYFPGGSGGEAQLHSVKLQDGGGTVTDFPAPLDTSNAINITVPGGAATGPGFLWVETVMGVVGTSLQQDKIPIIIT